MTGEPSSQSMPALTNKTIPEFPEGCRRIPRRASFGQLCPSTWTGASAQVTAASLTDSSRGGVWVLARIRIRVIKFVVGKMFVACVTAEIRSSGCFLRAPGNLKNKRQ